MLFYIKVSGSDAVTLEQNPPSTGSVHIFGGLVVPRRGKHEYNSPGVRLYLLCWKKRLERSERKRKREVREPGGPSYGALESDVRTPWILF